MAVELTIFVGTMTSTAELVAQAVQLELTYLDLSREENDSKRVRLTDTANEVMRANDALPSIPGVIRSFEELGLMKSLAAVFPIYPALAPRG